MTQIRSGTGGTAAVLAGSLAAFPLLDVLSLLSRTVHSGELHVVGDGVEARLWVDQGLLVDRPGAAGDRLFELACLEDAWFTVTGTEPSEQLSEDLQRFEVEPLVEQVGPQVAEWRTLVRALPFAAVARMASRMPGPEVQIRSDQWRILSLIGAGRTVHEIVDVADGRPLETLRLVHELAEQELIAVEVPTAEPAGASRRRRASEAPESTELAGVAGVAQGASAGRTGEPVGPPAETTFEGPRSAVASIASATPDTGASKRTVPTSAAHDEAPAPAHATRNPGTPSAGEQAATPAAAAPVVSVRGVANAPAGWRRTIGAATVSAVSSVSSTGRRTSAHDDREDREEHEEHEAYGDAPASEPARDRAAQPADIVAEDPQDVRAPTTAPGGARRTGAATRRVAAYMPPPLAPDRWRPGTEPSSVSARPRTGGRPVTTRSAPTADDSHDPASSPAPAKSDA